MHIPHSDMSDPTYYLDKIGLDAPPELADIWALAAEVREMANVCTAPSPAPHAEDFTAGNIGHAIRERVIAEQVQAWARVNVADFERHAGSQARELYAAKAEEYLPKVAKATQRPLRTLTEAARHLHADDTAETVLERGEAAIKAWKDRDALKRADDQLSAAPALSVYFGQRLHDSTREQRATLRDLPEVLWWLDIHEVDELDRVDEELWDSSGADRWLEVIQAGYKPKLASPAEALERARVIADSRRSASVFVSRNEEKQLRTQRAWLDSYTSA